MLNSVRHILILHTLSNIVKMSPKCKLKLEMEVKSIILKQSLLKKVFDIIMMLFHQHFTICYVEGNVPAMLLTKVSNFTYTQEVS